jgi:hypothetical protein
MCVCSKGVSVQRIFFIFRVPWQKTGNTVYLGRSATLVVFFGVLWWVLGLRRLNMCCVGLLGLCDSWWGAQGQHIVTSVSVFVGS